MPALLRALLRAAPVLPALLLAACDSEDLVDRDTVTFDGVSYTAIGGARLVPTAGGLSVRRGDGGEYGVGVGFAGALDGALAEAAFRVEPVDLPADGRWGLQLFGDLADGSPVPVATVWSDAVDEDTHVINFDFGEGTGVETVTLEYYLDGQLQHRVPGVPVAAGGGRLRLTPAGETEGLAGSVHVIRDGTRYIVATDYGGSPPRTTPGGCAAALLRVAFPGVPPEICTDYVQAVPDQFENVEAVTGLEIRARTLDQFTLVGGSLE